MDDGLCQPVRAAFSAHGINPDRLDLCPASPHAEALGQYADIDIALDPFPFTGGLTSCEALWMGVPVVTWPQNRAVSRQTFALLSSIGLAELVADSAEGYVHIARSLASDLERLANLRSGLRARMQSSPLMDVAGFTCQLEAVLRGLHVAIGK